MLSASQMPLELLLCPFEICKKLPRRMSCQSWPSVCFICIHGNFCIFYYARRVDGAFVHSVIIVTLHRPYIIVVSSSIAWKGWSMYERLVSRDWPLFPFRAFHIFGSRIYESRGVFAQWFLQRSLISFQPIATSCLEFSNCTYGNLPYNGANTRSRLLSKFS